MQSSAKNPTGFSSGSVNGAVNILKKYLRDFLSRSIGDVASPSVARITNVCPCEV